LNRGVEGRQGPDKRPQLADLRESGAIEQDADMVCFIHRPEYYKITEDEKGHSLLGIAEIIIAKHRNGATGDIRLRFKSEFAKFMNVDDDIPVRTFTSTEINGSADALQPIAPAGPDFLSQTHNEMPF
jgi:replicative DNA helicase